METTAKALRRSAVEKATMKRASRPILLLALLAAVALAGGACQRQARGSEANRDLTPTTTKAEDHAETRAETAAGESQVSRTLAQDQSALNRVPLKLPLPDPKIVVNKSARRLILYSGGRVVRTYVAALGFEAVKDKEKEGDGATPEGEFYVCRKNAASRFHRSLGLSYPNEEDAARGLRDRLITRTQHDEIVRAIRRKRRPPWYTPLGGEIFIHGGGSQTDWTLGCVALTDEEAEELFDAVPVGTPVTINP